MLVPINPPPGPSGLAEPIRMEGFGEAYLRALAASQGFAVIRETDDFDSIDLSIVARGHVWYQGRSSRMRSPRLVVQLKCSSKYQELDGVLKHDLPVKNYDELRLDSYGSPRVLMVVRVPPDWQARMAWTPEALVLRHCAYWCCLTGLPPTKNRRTCRVLLQQRLSPEELTRIMFCVAEDRPL